MFNVILNGGVRRVGFFLICFLLVSIQGFFALSGEGGALGIIGPTKGETFYGDEVSDEVSININDFIQLGPFSFLQATEETQLRWVRLMDYNPSRFKKEEHCSDTHMEIEVKGHKVSLCPTHPVESVSWWSVVVYANRLSEQRGLDPIYDLSDIEFEGTAAKGTLKATGGKLRINAPDGNIYNTKGFRLPTQEELKYAASDNIPWEWTHDWYKHDSHEYDHRPWKIPPRRPLLGGESRDIRDCCSGWYYLAAVVNNHSFRSRISPDSCGATLGFRLIRNEDGRDGPHPSFRIRNFVGP